MNLGETATYGRGASVNKTRADRKERVTLSTELDGIFFVDIDQGSLGDAIRNCSDVPGLLDELRIASSTRDVDNLLLDALLYQGKEGVGYGHRTNDIGPVLFHASA